MPDGGLPAEQAGFEPSEMPLDQVWDVIVIGAGPAGLSAARVLVAGGLRRVLVLERNPVAGGLPRFCAHRGWGLTDFRRLWTGPTYAHALVARAGGATILTNATVVGLAAGGVVRVSLPAGLRSLQGRAVLLATGIRELPRGPRLVGGSRPWGVTTTGAFQELVVSGLRPFRRPVVIGSELVAFSALLTARHAGIRPVAMLEPGPRITARRPGALIARLGFGVPVLTGATLDGIDGGDSGNDPGGGGRVEAVRFTRHGRAERLDCDGVIFTGRFVPEAWLGRDGAFAIDPGTGGPVIDSVFRCSAEGLFAAGNVLRPVEHAGIAAAEGCAAAAAILRALSGAGLPPPERAVSVVHGDRLRYVVPQRLLPEGLPLRLHARAAAANTGRLRLVLRADGGDVAGCVVRALPERRLRLTVAPAGLKNLAGATVQASLE